VYVRYTSKTIVADATKGLAALQDVAFLYHWVLNMSEHYEDTVRCLELD
jgi:hypothetical protein